MLLFYSFLKYLLVYFPLLLFCFLPLADNSPKYRHRRNCNLLAIQAMEFHHKLIHFLPFILKPIYNGLISLPLFPSDIFSLRVLLICGKICRKLDNNRISHFYLNRSHNTNRLKLTDNPRATIAYIRSPKPIPFNDTANVSLPAHLISICYGIR